MNNTNAEEQKRWIKYIQTGRSSLRLSDEEYISILLGAAGVDSSSKITTEKQFLDVKKALRTLGFGAESLTTAVITRAKKALGESWQARLSGFIKSHIKKQTVWQCSPGELKECMAFLTKIEREGRK